MAPKKNGVGVKNVVKNDPERKENAAARASRLRTTEAGNSAALVPVVQLPPVVQTPNGNNNGFESATIEGKFGWTGISYFSIPYIYRTIGIEQSKFVSVRMVETEILRKYMLRLSPDVHECGAVPCFNITRAEGKLLETINGKHCEFKYGKQVFLENTDYVVQLEKVIEFRNFMDNCFNMLTYTSSTLRSAFCGFVRIDGAVVPYSVQRGQKYVPIFYFEGHENNLPCSADKLESWSLAYFKFCCRIQGIRNELYIGDSCTVVNLDMIKSYFSPDTTFDECWPDSVAETDLLINENNSHTITPNAWIKVQSAMIDNVLAPESAVLPRTLPAAAGSASQLASSAPGNALQQTVSAPGNILIQALDVPTSPALPPNGTLANITCQMVNSYNDQVGTAPTQNSTFTSSYQSVAAPNNNSGPAIVQQSNGSIHDTILEPPPPSMPIGVTASVENAVVNFNSVQTNQMMTFVYNPTTIYSPMTTMYNNPAMSTSSTTPSHSNATQMYSIPISNGDQATAHQDPIFLQQQLTQLQQQLIKLQQAHNHLKQEHLKLQQRTAAMNRNSQPRIVTVNRRSAANIAPNVIVDLSSPPTSPALQNVNHDHAHWTATQIPENSWPIEPSKAYQVRLEEIGGKPILSINATPFMNTDRMVTVKDLVCQLMPSSTVSQCARVLCNDLRKILYNANSEQLHVLRKAGCLRPDEASPMIMLHEINQVLMRLTYILGQQNVETRPGTSKPKMRRLM